MPRNPAALLDAAVAPIVCGVIVAASVAGGAGLHPILIGLLAGASLAARGRAPYPVLAVSVAAVAVLVPVDHAVAAVSVLAPAVALVSLALRHGSGAWIAAAAIAGLAVVVAADAVTTTGTGMVQTLGHVALVAVSLLGAQVLRARDTNEELIADRHALIHQRRAQEQLAQLERERIRIARDVHDVIAHTLTAINVQATTGAALADTDPGHAKHALQTIEDQSRSAIAELRSILGVLRDDGADPPAGPRAPAPGIATLTELVQRERATGMDVTLTLTGTGADRVPEVVSLAAYRIVQESLTNARRHAAGAPVRVDVDLGARTVGLAVENPIMALAGDPPVRGGRGGHHRHARAGRQPGRPARRRGRGRRVPGGRVPAPPGAVVIRVLVADDQATVRAGFAALVDGQPGMTTVGQAHDGRDAVDGARMCRPDVVLMDIRMPGMDGIDATRLICADPALRGTRVLVLTTFDLDEYVYGALRAGASGFLLKDAGAQELLHAIEVVAAGEAMLAPTTTRRLIAEFAARRDPQAVPDAVADLTPREGEILALVARGLNNGEIAARLFISPLTAKTHVRNILMKLGCRDRAALTTLAYETRFISPGDTA